MTLAFYPLDVCVACHALGHIGTGDMVIVHRVERRDDGLLIRLSCQWGHEEEIEFPPDHIALAWRHPEYREGGWKRQLIESEEGWRKLDDYGSLDFIHAIPREAIKAFYIARRDRFPLTNSDVFDVRPYQYR